MKSTCLLVRSAKGDSPIFVDAKTGTVPVRSLKGTVPFSLTRKSGQSLLLCLAVCGLLGLAGCHAVDFYEPSLQRPIPPEMEPPRELRMVSEESYMSSRPTS